VSRVSIYFDDDFAPRAVRAALSRLGVANSSTDDHGMRGAPDAEHLAFATSIGFVLCSSNVRDYMALHRAWLERGQHHAEMLLVIQKRWGVGELIGRLSLLAETLSAEEMVDRVEFLSSWGSG
jgi:hypothetical protein